jgi:porphobilinogen deaminase
MRPPPAPIRFTASPRRQQQAQDVDVELLVKELRGHVLDRRELVDAGIVDQIALPPRAVMSATTRSAPSRLDA